MYIFLYFILITASFSQTLSDNAYTGAQVFAMAGAVVSEEGDDWSIFHNPAGITEIDKIRFSTGGGNLYGFNWLPAYYMNGIATIPRIGKFELSLQQFETKYDGVTLSKEQTISIAQGFNLQKDKNSHLAIGYTANFVQWNLGKSAGISGDGSDGYDLGSLNSVTVDLGILASLREKYRFGMLIKNINSGALGKGMTRQILPRRINIGITYKPILNLATSITAERLLNRADLQVKGSIRYLLSPFLEIYSGAQSNPNRIGFGFQILINNLNESVGNHITFTYGILTHPVLPTTQQISLGIEL